MSTINLSNPRLREYIRNFLSLDRFREPFAVLIEEVFVREQYVLNLTPAEFYEDLCNFRASINTIEYGECGDNCMGFTDPHKKLILLDFDYWQNLINTCSPDVYCRKFFETFSHECLHGMQNIAGTYENRAGGYNAQIKNRAHAIYEICTQGIAAKMSYDRTRYEYDNDVVLTGDGYANEIFAVPLIAATFGVSENEVLKFGVRKREELVALLNRNINNMDVTRTLIEKIEMQLEYMHSIYYPDDTQVKFKNMTDSEKRQATTRVILNLVNICQEALCVRIKNTPLDFNKRMAIQYKYDQRKIINTLEHQFQNYSYDFEMDKDRFWGVVILGNNSDYIQDAINVFNQIGKNKNGVALHSAELVSAVINGDFSACERMGIEIFQNQTFSLVNNALDFKEEKVHEDYNDFNNWNNRVIYEALYQNRRYVEQAPQENQQLHMWNNGLYKANGYQKIRDLWSALTSNREKYRLVSKQYLLDFFDTPIEELENFYSKITKDNGARSSFKRSFNSVGDKEFLARLIASKYYDKYFEHNGDMKDVMTSKEREFQGLFSPTIKKNGKSQFEWAVAQLLVNDYYQAFSDEYCRTSLAIYGKKQIFDVIAQPLIDEILNLRKIVPEKREALRNAIYITEQSHPGTSINRVEKILSDYKRTKAINSELLSRGGRQQFKNYFTSQRDMEDLVGIICEDYIRVFEGKYHTSEQSLIQQQI